jgi:hypothetical protein
MGFMQMLYWAMVIAVIISSSILILCPAHSGSALKGCLLLLAGIAGGTVLAVTVADKILWAAVGPFTANHDKEHCPGCSDHKGKR